MDPGYYKDLRGRLFGLLIILESRMNAGDAQQVHEFIAVDEYGLALEELAGYLAVTGTPITDQERRDMTALTGTMQMDDDVSPHAGVLPPPGGRPARPVTGQGRTLIMASSGGRWLASGEGWCG
jgi:hypothetical protein